MNLNCTFGKNNTTTKFVCKIAVISKIIVYSYLSVLNNDATLSFQFCNYVDGKERAGLLYFNCLLIVILMSCDRWCSVALPGGAVGWSAVRDCGIS